jgi:tetratricopeptide (TPR) repeat protein
MATALIGLNRFDEARKTVEQGRAQKLDHPSYRSHLYAIAFVEGDTRAMQQELTSIRGKDGERAALALQARTAAFGGHWRDAQGLYRRVDEIDGQSSVIGTRATPPVAATAIAATFGFCDPAGPGASQALAVSRTNAPSLLFVPVLSDGSLCGDASEGQKLADEQARRYPAAIQVRALSVPIVRGAVELKRNQPARAIEVLSPAVGYEGGPAGFYAAYLRGQAYLRLRRTTEAASEFRKILDHRGWDPLSHFFPLAHLGLARALAISGDAEGSRRAYRDFVTLWQHADPDLPLLTEAKKELEQLK